MIGATLSMVDHPHFVPHSDYRETFRLSEINDPTCKLVVVTDDGLEILRRALKCARKRQNWIDSEDENGYTTPDDGDWDDITSTLDDLEYCLMSACDYVTLDDANERVGIVAPSPQAKLQVGIINQSTNYADGILVYGGDAGPGTSVLRAKMYAGADALRVGGSGITYLVGPVGIGDDSPSYALDVTGAVRVTGAFGCNGQAPAAAYALPGSASDLSTAITLVNALRAALDAMGICHI